MREAPTGNSKAQLAGGWAFLIVVLGVYASVALFNVATVQQALADFGSLLRHLIPALVLMFVVTFVIHLRFDAEDGRHYLGSAASMRSWVLAISAGVLSLGSVYPWYALLGELRTRGMHSALIAAFLHARAIKLPLLPLMAHYFGLAYTVVLSLCLLAFSVISGWILGRLVAEDRCDP